MNDRSSTVQLAPQTMVGACECCTPPRALLAQQATTGPARWAVCSHTGLWHENRGDGLFQIMAGTPGATTNALEDNRAIGGRAPVLTPGVRIDLSRESYA